VGAEEAPLLHRIRGPLSTWWQVKDSNLRSFRDGFTDHGRQAPDQRECLFPPKLTCVFPTNNRPQPTATGHPGEQFAFPTSPYDAEPDPSTRVDTMVEVACQLNSVLNSPAEFRVPSRRCPQSGGGRGIPGWRIRARACSAMRRARRWRCRGSRGLRRCPCPGGLAGCDRHTEPVVL